MNKRERLLTCFDEANQILSIVVSSIKTARSDGAKEVPYNPQSAIRNPKSNARLGCAKHDTRHRASRRCQAARAFWSAEAVYRRPASRAREAPAVAGSGGQHHRSRLARAERKSRLKTSESSAAIFWFWTMGFIPSLLREIYDPPIALYVKGAWSRMPGSAVRRDRWFAQDVRPMGRTRR